MANSGGDYFTEDDEIDWNGEDNEDHFTAEELEVLEDAIAIYLFFWVTLFGMFAGFFVFPPLSICLAYTGGELDTCSFGLYE